MGGLRRVVVTPPNFDGAALDYLRAHGCDPVLPEKPEAQHSEEELRALLAGAQGWVTGLRADQSDHRQGLAFVSFDEARGLIKLNPIFDWTRADAVAFTPANNVPVNALHGQGFLSIGCAPCTRAIAAGEPERAGRWWWENEAKKECGLHVSPDGRLSRAGAPA